MFSKTAKLWAAFSRSRSPEAVRPTPPMSEERPLQLSKSGPFVVLLSKRPTAYLNFLSMIGPDAGASLDALAEALRTASDTRSDIVQLLAQLNWRYHTIVCVSVLLSP